MITPRSRFDTTRWSVILASRGDHSSAARAALTTLCETYWYPLYAYVRRQGYGADDASDLTQSFFVLLLERNDLREVNQARGRFRSFLLAALRHFLLNDVAHRHTLKRGGSQVVLPLEFETAEGRYVREPPDTTTPEAVFDRRWALAMLERVLRHLRAEWTKNGKDAAFERLKSCLLGDLPDGGYRELAAELAMSEGAVKVAVHRLRRQFQRRLREQVASTVASEDEVDDEMRYLVKALTR